MVVAGMPRVSRTNDMTSLNSQFNAMPATTEFQAGATSELIWKYGLFSLSL